MKTQYLLSGLLGIMTLTNVTYAEVNFGKRIPTTSEVIDALSQDDEGGATTKNRSISLEALKLPPKTVKKISKENLSTLPPLKKPTVSMEIIFGYNSAQLTDTGKQQLRPVGEAMASEKLQNQNFIIEGHTDAIGSQAYNINLSEERATAVKAFLVSNFNIAPTHIKIIGKGKSDLFDPSNPASEVNRRVLIITK